MQKENSKEKFRTTLILLERKLLSKFCSGTRITVNKLNLFSNDFKPMSQLKEKRSIGFAQSLIKLEPSRS